MTETRTPNAPAPEDFTDPAAAVARLEELYEQATGFLCDSFADAIANGSPSERFRAYYPEIRIRTSSYAQVDSRLSFRPCRGTRRPCHDRNPARSVPVLPDPADRLADPEP